MTKTNKRVERVMRNRTLTPEEAARDAEVRRAVEAEFPPAHSPRHPNPGSLSGALQAALQSASVAGGHFWMQPVTC